MSIAYPMSDAWRRAAERHMTAQREQDERRDARAKACVEALLRQHLEAQGFTVTSVHGLNVDVTYPVGMVVPDDWYEQARTWALDRASALLTSKEGA
jgi:hypothetical protein